MDSIGTCPICLTDISPADEAFVEPCLHHFCFQCIQAWVKIQQDQSSPVRCPVCKTFFDSIIYDCHDVSHRIWSINGSTTAAAGKHLSRTFGLNAEQRRRRSLYSISLNPESSEAVIADQSFPADFQEGNKNKFITLGKLNRPAVAQWLQRELQALLLQEDVDILCQHIIGNLKHGIEVSSQENKRLKRPGRGFLKCDAAVEIVAEAMAPYMQEHAKRLGQEFIGFILSGLNVDAHDALVFRIKEAEEDVESEGSIEASEDEVEFPPPSE